MTIKEITDSIFYVGTNDRTTTRFEGLWPLPFGVSYNSYVVKGKKTALIDTVNANSASEFKEHIKSVIGEQNLDYLVINHMEPDHSGSIKFIIESYPEVKIIGNKLTIDMIKGFYHIFDDERYIQIIDGQEIDLDGKTLKFITTPMVHWPETMMTYVVEDKLLFSGDAFGTFGALAGAIVDDDMNTDIYIEELYRYYSNIVGKYGKFVAKALAKASTIEIDYICSTHGPVWHEQISKIVSLYDKLSRYETEQGVVIVYGSMYGNTAKVAENIASRLADRGIKNIKMHNASFSDLSYILSDIFKYKALIVGGPTYSMELFPPIDSLMKALQTREITNRIFAAFGSYTWAPIVTKKMKCYCDSMNISPIADMEMRQGGDEQSRKTAIEIADAVADALFEEKKQ